MGFPLDYPASTSTSTLNETCSNASSSSIPTNSASCPSTSAHSRPQHHPQHQMGNAPHCSSPIKYSPALNYPYCLDGSGVPHIYGSILPAAGHAHHAYENTVSPTPRPPTSIPSEASTIVGESLDGSGVTYTPLMQPYSALSSAYSHGPAPHEVTCFSHAPYFNQQGPESPGNGVDELSLDEMKRRPSMDDLTLDEYHQRYGDHFKSSAL